MGVTATPTALDSALRPTNTQNRSSSAASASGNQPALSATATGAKTSTSKRGSNDKRVSEIEVNPSGNGASLAYTEDLKPAIAGGTLLMLSLGALLFAWRFVKRESVAA